jgi:hypothetical protein
MKVYLVTGTGTDESAANAAYTVNAGGGGSAWTGGVATGVSVTIGTANQRYTVAIPVPSATTQVAVALCWTPVGTAGASDYIAFSGIQLTRNSALTTVAGTAGVALSVNDTRAKAFARRAQAPRRPLAAALLLQDRGGCDADPAFRRSRSRRPALATERAPTGVPGRVSGDDAYRADHGLYRGLCRVHHHGGNQATGNCSALAAATSITYVVSTQQAMALCN